MTAESKRLALQQRVTPEIARRLRAAGLTWHPQPGDAFLIDSAELDGEVFTVSDMTIEPHEFDTGTILGFNGTTEWALDSVALERTLWLPGEGQLRELLGRMFRSLTLVDGRFRVELAPARGPASGPPEAPTDWARRASAEAGAVEAAEADSAADAYALALLALIE